MTDRLVVMAMQARCPQWWRVFSVRGKTGTYEVYADDVLGRTRRCSCWGFIFGGRGATCKHIKLVRCRGCLAVRDERAAGPNDLGDVGVEITDAARPVARLYDLTELPCKCGDRMRAPRLRMDDGAGHQIVRVRFGGGGAEYAYACGGKRALAEGDPVTPPASGQRGTVVALGSDYAGVLTVIGEARRP